MINLYQEREVKRLEARNHLQAETWILLKALLLEFFPKQKVWIFGSLVKAGKFHSYSDIDLAIEKVPEGRSEFEIAVAMEERIKRPVDLVLLGECRFKSKILKEGLLWIQ